jgi:hypothetical protein
MDVGRLFRLHGIAAGVFLIKTTKVGEIEPSHFGCFNNALSVAALGFCFSWCT